MNRDSTAMEKIFFWFVCSVKTRSLMFTAVFWVKIGHFFGDFMSKIDTYAQKVRRSEHIKNKEYIYFSFFWLLVNVVRVQCSLSEGLCSLFWRVL
jgi:hypothetical protein